MNLDAFSAKWSTKNPILVTGHTGFKGTWLTLLLEQLQIEAVGFSLEAKDGSMYDRLNRRGQITEVFCDIRNEEGLQKFIEQTKPSAIIHLAAQPLVLESYKNPKETCDVNVIGTANLIQVAVRASSVESIVVSTTDKVYKNVNSGRRFIESDPLEGLDPYSSSKVATESVIRSWQSILGKDVKLTSARAGNVIGGGDFSENRIIPDCVRAHVSQEVLRVRYPESIRPWQHVLEPLYGYLLALESGTQPAYNFGPRDDFDIKVKDVVELFRALIPFEYKVEEEVPPLYESSLLSLDSNLATQDLKWRQIYSQKEAIENTAMWWRAALNHEDVATITEGQIGSFLSEHRTSV